MNMPSSILRFASMLGILALAGCASNAPLLIRQAPPRNPSVAAVQKAPQRYLGQTVRWGGTIVAVKNLKQRSRVEVVSRPLYGDGEPKEGDTSDGRFLADVPGFLDPAIYAAGRAITVTGTVSGSRVQRLDELPYRYPELRAEAHYLWPKRVPACRDCDPFNSWPWYPYGYPYGYPYFWYMPPPRVH